MAGNQRENYFLLLELPFDPPETDQAKIETAIKQKSAQWSRDQNNPMKKVAAGRHLEMLPDIKAVMLDEEKRKAEAKAAIAYRESKRAEFNSVLQLQAAKGTDLTPADIKNLLKRFGPAGFTEKDIRKSFRPFSEKPEQKIGAVIPINIANQISSSITQLGKGDANLYDILGMPQNSSCSALVAKADELRQKMIAKGNKTAEDEALQKLSALAKEIFKSPEEKAKYDNYLKLTRYPKANQIIDSAAQMTKKVIGPKQKDIIVENILKDHKDLSLSEINTYIQNYCDYKGYTLSGGKIICASCGTENPAGATVCSKCGKPLIVICPRCGAKNDNKVKICVQCSIDFSKAEAIQKMLRDARESIASRKYEQAEKLISQAKIDWPDNKDIAPLEEEIRNFRGKYGSAVQEISAAVSAKEYYKAKGLIGKAQATGYQIDASIVSAVDQAISNAESRLSRVRNMDPESAFTLLEELSGQVKDSSEINAALKNYPPEAPSKMTVSIIGGKAVLKWEPSRSKGDIQYVVVRKENVYPNSTEDGRIYTGRELSYTDGEVKKNILEYYGVFAVRIGVASTMCRIPEPVVSVDPVKNLRAVGDDGSLNLSWDCGRTVSEVRIGIAESLNQPASDSAYTAVPNNRLDGAVLTRLKNGTRYWLRVQAFHQVSGKAYPSAPVIINAVPEKPAKPLENFHAEFSDDRFHASWSASEWDVVLFASTEKPEYSVGMIYDVNEIRRKYEQIRLVPTGDMQGDFQYDFTGQCYIIPGVISARNLILNTPVYITNVPAPKEAYADFNQSGTEMYVGFDWPKRAERAVVLYRMDKYPESPEDPMAKRVECNKRQFDDNAGILVMNPPEGIMYAVVYMFFDDGEKKIYSSGVQTLINNEPQRDVSYSFQYKKRGLFSKANILTVEVSSSGKFVFPKFVVVAKYSSVPLKRDDGEIIGGVAEETEINGRNTFKMEIPDQRKGTRLKLFFTADKEYKKFRIRNEGNNTL